LPADRSRKAPPDRSGKPRVDHGRLTRDTLHAAVAELAARDADLAGIVERHGPPPLWDRQPWFATLLHIVLEQQV